MGIHSVTVDNTIPYTPSLLPMASHEVLKLLSLCNSDEWQIPVIAQLLEHGDAK